MNKKGEWNAKKGQIHIRVPENLKNEFEIIVNQMGTSTSDMFRLFMTQVVLHKRI